MPDRASQLGWYPILERLGRGRTGAVFCARNRRRQQDVAFQVASTARSGLGKAAPAAGALPPPSLVAMADLDPDDKARESRAGERPLRRLPPSGIPSRWWLAASALQAARARSIWHRGRNPGNRVRQRDGVWKLLDLALARRHQAAGPSATQILDGLVAATPAGWPPEPARADRFPAFRNHLNLPPHLRGSLAAEGHAA